MTDSSTSQEIYGFNAVAATKSADLLQKMQIGKNATGMRGDFFRARRDPNQF